MRKPRLLSKMKRVEIAQRDEVLELIEQHATGYSIVPNVTGFGEHGLREGHMTLIVTVVTDVRVMRPEHFMPEVRAFTAKQPPRIDP